MGDSSLCDACRALAPASLLPLRDHTHKETYAELVTSAGTCKLCAFIVQALPHEGSYKGQTYDLKPDSGIGPIQISAGVSRLDHPSLEDLSTLRVKCSFLHGELSVYGGDPGMPSSTSSSRSN
jgi:hypothetical protein